MLSDALVLAFLSTIGLALTFKKLPRKLRLFLQKKALFTDFLTFIITYLTLGSTLTALTAGAMVAIFTSALLYILDHPEDFIYLNDLYNFMRDSISSMKVGLTEMGKQYREKKLQAESTL